MGTVIEVRMRMVLFLIVFLGLLGCEKPQPTPPPPPEAPVVAKRPSFGPFDALKNATMFRENIMVSGQPTVEQFEVLSEMGVDVVLSLRTEGEVAFDEKQKVVDLGMEFASIPIRGESGLTQDAVENLNGLLGGFEGKKILIHCGTGNRVGAMLALRAGWLQGLPTDKALAIGKAAGLSSLEDEVIEKLKVPVVP